ncbi:hypothetical protein [Mycobacterium sp. MMS18-G62]
MHRSYAPRHTARAAPSIATSGRETGSEVEAALGPGWASPVTTPLAPPSAPSLRQLAGWCRAWLRDHPVTALATVLVGGAFSYAWNVWLIAALYRGPHRVPVGSAATGSRNFIYGGLFWALCGMLIFGLASYWHAVGTRRFFTELQGLPLALGGLIHRDHAARVHLLWGAALAMLLAVALSPAVGLVVAIGLLTIAPGFIGSIVSAFLARAWSRLTARFSPTRRAKIAGATGVTVGTIGSAGALVAAFLIPSTAIKLIVVAVLAVLALTLSRIGPPSTGALLVALGPLLFLAWVSTASQAFADTGASPDCPCTAGLSCMADPATLINSLVGAVSGGLGALAGALAGAAAAAADASGGVGVSAPAATAAQSPSGGGVSDPPPGPTPAGPATGAPPTGPGTGAPPGDAPSATQSADDADKAARRADLERQHKLDEAAAQSLNQASTGWGYLYNAAWFVSKGADTAVNVLSNFTGPAGRAVNYAYGAVKDTAGGIAEGQSASQIGWHVVADTSLTFMYNQIPCNVPTYGVGPKAPVSSLISAAQQAEHPLAEQAAKAGLQYSAPRVGVAVGVAKGMGNELTGEAESHVIDQGYE